MTHSPPLPDEPFWDVIDQLDRNHPWGEGADWAVICRPAIERLTQLGPEGIGAWFETFARKLHAIDTPAHHKQARYGWWPFRMSSDVFLYARCQVVGSGRALYEKVLTDPRAFPRNMWAEDFLYLADHAYEAVTGKPFDRESSVSCESFSNPIWSKS